MASRLKGAPVRLLAVASVGLALAAGTAGHAEAGTAAATTGVNIRSGPGTSHAVVGGLARGQRITTTSSVKAGWVAVDFAGRRAYIAARYLDRKGAASRPARATARPASPSGRSLSGVRTSARGRTAVAFAKRQLGKPYVFGATGPSSYDCSGLTLAAWRAAHVGLPRTSQQQYRSGHRIARSRLRAGDLVFFYGRSPSHVGIYVGNGRVIHAPRPGRSVEYTRMSYMPYVGAVRPG